MASWGTREIGTGPAPGETRRFPHACPPLMRFLGGWGFTLVGVGTVTLGQFLFGIRSRFWENPPLSIGEVMLLVVGFLAATTGMFLGGAMGLSMPVRDERNVFRIATVWHFQACGTLLWVLLLGLAMTKAFGADEAKEHIKTMSEWYLVGVVLALTAVGCSLMGVAVLLTGQFRKDEKPAFLGAVLSVLPIALALGYLEFRLLGVPGNDWVFASVVLAVASVPAASYFIQRDMAEREQLLKRAGCGEEQ